MKLKQIWSIFAFYTCSLLIFFVHPGAITPTSGGCWGFMPACAWHLAFLQLACNVAVFQAFVIWGQGSATESCRSCTTRRDPSGLQNCTPIFVAGWEVVIGLSAWLRRHLATCKAVEPSVVWPPRWQRWVDVFELNLQQLFHGRVSRLIFGRFVGEVARCMLSPTRLSNSALDWPRTTQTAQLPADALIERGALASGSGHRSNPGSNYWMRRRVICCLPCDGFFFGAKAVLRCTFWTPWWDPSERRQNWVVKFVAMNLI